MASLNYQTFPVNDPVVNPELENMAAPVENQEVLDDVPQSPNTSSNPSEGISSASSSGCFKPGLRRVSSFYTPYMEDKLRRRLKFHFMGPHEKFKARRKCPWKLLIQILKIFLITGQLIQFGFTRFNFVNYTESSTIAMKHLYLKKWDNSYETMPYPPAVGTYAIYTRHELYDHIDFAVNQYYNTENISIGSFKLLTESDLKLCLRLYRNGTIANGTYTVDADIVKKCRTGQQLLKPTTANSTYHNIKTFLEGKFDRLLNVELLFHLMTYRLDMNMRASPPQCFRTSVNITFDDSNKDGQMLIKLDTLFNEVDCHEKYAKGSKSQAEFRERALLVLFDVIIILVTTISMLLCARSVVRALKLRKVTALFFKERYGKSLSMSDQMEFLNLWYVTIIINDVMTIIGSALKIQLETKNLKSSGGNFDVCAVMLGLGGLLAWTGVLRYIGFFHTFNILIVTLKRAFPSLLRFSVCALMIYFGFMFCGWVVMGPYHVKFRHLSTASECLFSLINGDDMFVTFSATVTNNQLVWYFSRIYLYLFIALFIYAVLSLFIAIIMQTYETLKEYDVKGFPKSDLFKFIEECKDPIHSSIYRREDNSCNPCKLLSRICCCCKRNPDHPNEYTNLIN